MNQFRNLLTNNMTKLDSQEKNCLSCTGVCCTVSRNSMMVTPLEAYELYLNLMKKIQNQELLWKKVESAFKEFGLDREIYVKNKLMRKNYTCPLFKLESFGCPVDPESKPFGCLGYNPTKEKVLDGESCSSDIIILEQVENEIKKDFEMSNLEIRKQFNLSFEKTNIPAALLELKAKAKKKI